MAVDLKYGAVTVEREPGNPLGKDEPVVVFRARDGQLQELLRHYLAMCQIAGSPVAHIDAIHEAWMNVRRWQEAHPELVKVPD